MVRVVDVEKALTRPNLPVPTSEHQVAMDVRTLAQLGSGFITARQGARADLIQGSPGQLAWLDSVFGQVRAHINDFF